MENTKNENYNKLEHIKMLQKIINRMSNYVLSIMIASMIIFSGGVTAGIIIAKNYQEHIYIPIIWFSCLLLFLLLMWYLNGKYLKLELIYRKCCALITNTKKDYGKYELNYKVIIKNLNKNKKISVCKKAYFTSFVNYLFLFEIIFCIVSLIFTSI